MVFELLGRTFGNYGDRHRYLNSNENIQEWIQEGFSEEEAKKLQWFAGKQSRGKLYGLVTGAALLYYYNDRFTLLLSSYPRLAYNKNFGLALKGSLLFSCVYVGDYLTSGRRYSANHWFGNMYNNVEFSNVRDSFVGNFEPLNRKFTPQEIEQFQMNGSIRERNPRKWIYNPYVHGDEQQWRAHVEKYNKNQTNPAEHPAVKARVEEENLAKTQNGEEVQLKAYSLKQDFKTGIAAGRAQNPLYGWSNII